MRLVGATQRGGGWWSHQWLWPLACDGWPCVNNHASKSWTASFCCRVRSTQSARNSVSTTASLFKSASHIATSPSWCAIMPWTKSTFALHVKFNAIAWCILEKASTNAREEAQLLMAPQPMLIVMKWSEVAVAMAAESSNRETVGRWPPYLYSYSGGVPRAARALGSHLP